jgi:hypothetical protein
VIQESQSHGKITGVNQQTPLLILQDQGSQAGTDGGVLGSFYFDALMTQSSISLLAAPDAPSGTTIRTQGFFEAEQESYPSLV